MVNLENGKMTIDGEHWFPIEKWTCWFMTPFGVCSDLGPAVRMCKAHNHDPEMVIVPVTVAISTNKDVEIVRR